MSIFQEASSTVFAKLADTYSMKQDDLAICITFFKNILLGTYSYQFQDSTLTGFISEKDFNYTITFVESLMRTIGETRPLTYFCSWMIDWTTRLGIGAPYSTSIMSENIRIVNVLEQYLAEPITPIFDGVTNRIVLFNFGYSYGYYPIPSENRIGLQYSANFSYVDENGETKSLYKEIVVDTSNTIVAGYRVVGGRYFDPKRSSSTVLSVQEARLHKLSYQWLVPIVVKSASVAHGSGTITVIG